MNITENEQVIEVKIVNEFVFGNIRLTKVDADYPDNKLTGATFELYKDIDEMENLIKMMSLLENSKKQALEFMRKRNFHMENIL